MSNLPPEEMKARRPVEQAAGRVTALEERMDKFEGAVQAWSVVTDSEVADLFAAVEAALTIAKAAYDAVSALAADANNPLTAAAAARGHLEGAHEPQPGDDAVVPAATEDRSEDA